jgi:outer membrane protein assembly factor BamB
MSRLAAAVAAILVIGSLAHAADWPQWRGPDRTGAIEGGPALADAWPKEGPVKVWESEPLQCGGPGGCASPVVADGRMYVYATEQKDGKKTEVVLCLDAATGKTLWKVQGPSKTENGSSTIAVSGGRCYGLGDESAYCLDAATGKEIWKVRCAGGNGSPLVEDGLVVVMADELTAFDAVQGVFAWTQPAVKGGNNSPVVWRSGRKKYVIYNNNGTRQIACAGLADGKVLWTVAGGGSESTPAVSGDILVVATDKAGLTAYQLGLAKPQEIWNMPDLKTVGASPVISKGRVYATAAGKNVCVDLQKGTVIWEGPNGGDYYNSPIISGDRLFAPSQSGLFQMIRAGTDKYEELASAKDLGVGPCTTPVVVDGKLYVRHEKGVACYDLTKGPAAPAAPVAPAPAPAASQASPAAAPAPAAPQASPAAPQGQGK